MLIDRCLIAEGITLTRMVAHHVRLPASRNLHVLLRRENTRLDIQEAVLEEMQQAWEAHRGT